MALEDVFQLRFVEAGLLEKLFDARLVLQPPHTGGNGNDVLGAENFRGHAFVMFASSPALYLHSCASNCSSLERVEGLEPS